MSLSASIITVGAIGYASTGMAIAVYCLRKPLRAARSEGATRFWWSVVTAIFLFITAAWPVWLLASGLVKMEEWFKKTRLGGKWFAWAQNSKQVFTLGCYAPQALLVVFTVATVFLFATAWVHNLPWALRAVGYALFVFYLLFDSIPALAHDKRLCVRCQGTVPLDGWEEARKRKRVLSVWHWEDRHPLSFLALFVGLVGSDFTALPYARLILGTLVATLGAHRYVGHAHKTLYPWCPYCHDGDDGDGGFWPQTDPAGDRSLTR